MLYEEALVKNLEYFRDNDQYSSIHFITGGRGNSGCYTICCSLPWPFSLAFILRFEIQSLIIIILHFCFWRSNGWLEGQR